MQKQARIIPPQEIPEELLRLSRTSLDVHGPEDRNDIFQEKLCIVSSAVLESALPRTGDTTWVGLLRVQESEDLQLASDPFPCARDQRFIAIEHLR